VTGEIVVLSDWETEAGGGYLLEIADDGMYDVVDKSTEVVNNGLWRPRGFRLGLFCRTSRLNAKREISRPWRLRYIKDQTAPLRGTVG
jgi:hypothetical protein